MDTTRPAAEFVLLDWFPATVCHHLVRRDELGVEMFADALGEAAGL